MAAAFLSSIFTVTIFFLCNFFASIDAQHNGGGFSVELLHRDAPNSPFYNPQETPAQRLANAFHRSIDRVRHFSASIVSTKTAKSEIVSNNGEYLMSISIGTPPFPILAIADTGSDLIWTQCNPCSDCYNQTAPLFSPKSSTTYRDLTCRTPACQSLDQTQTSCQIGHGGSICRYSYQYGDQSFTKGNLAVETVTLDSTSGRPVSHPNAVFGCGHSNAGTFNEKGSGIIGLGGGPLSLVSQLGSAIGGKFSYCLVPFGSSAKNSSTMNFGSKAIVSGEGVLSTPLFSKDPTTFYFLTLESVSVGSKRIPFISSFGTNEGNIIIDSGTTLTLVPEDFYQQLEEAVVDAVKGTRVDDPQQVLNLCYSISSSSGDSDLKFPTITAHFTGADVELIPTNTFVQVSDGVVCLAFVATEQGAIFGNLAQMNYQVGYDLQAKTLSFKPTDCTKF